MARVLRSGALEADPALRALKKHGRALAVTPKVFEALVVFLRSGNRVLSRDELSEALWPGQVVTEANLNQHVSMLRKALGDGVGGEKYLLTAPGRGYQWVVPVEEVETGGGRKAWWGAAALVALAVGGLTWWALRGRGEGALEYTPVTRLQGSEFQPAISADGARVAYVWDEEGHGGAQIYVREKGSQRQTRVSGGLGSCRSPVWSPEGRRVAYVCTAQGRAEVLITELGGGTERFGALHPLSYGLTARQLDWSPDGGRLAVADKQEERAPYRLYEIDLKTRIRRALTTPLKDDVGDLEPRYSPDGRWLAFARQKIRFRHELMVMPAAGGEPVRAHGEDTELGGLDWSGDGKALYYSSNPRSEFRVWRLAWSGTKADEPEATELHGEHPIQFSVARRVAALVYSMFRQDTDIWRLTLDGGRAEWRRLIASTADDSMPQYSPDGGRICFRSNRTGDEQLWVSDAEGENATQVTEGQLWPTLGRWSPDGRMLAFNRYGTREGYVIWPGEPGRGTLRLGDIEHPSFTADGREIVYVVSGELRIREVAGGRDRRISKHAEGGYPTAFSSDGRYVYYTGGRTDPSVWRAEVATGREEKVLDGLAPGCWACWALQGERLYSVSMGTTPWADARLMVLDVGTRKAEELATIPQPLAPLGTGALSVSPDGKKFLMVRVNRANTDVLRVEGFR